MEGLAFPAALEPVGWAKLLFDTLRPKLILMGLEFPGAGAQDRQLTWGAAVSHEWLGKCAADGWGRFSSKH